MWNKLFCGFFFFFGRHLFGRQGDRETEDREERFLICWSTLQLVSSVGAEAEAGRQETPSRFPTQLLETPAVGQRSAAFQGT